MKKKHREGHHRFGQWYWMPITVFSIGIVSIILLLWVERISEKLHIDEVLVDAIMDVQIRTATAHLRLEEIIRGEPEVEAEKGFAELDQAIFLVDTTLRGGATEYRVLSEPLEDPELRARAETIKSLLIQFKIIALKRLQEQESERSGSGSALYQEFHAVFREILGKARALEDIIERDEAKNQRQSKRLFRSILLIWAFTVAVATTSLWSRERRRQKAEEALLKANEQLRSQAEELKGHREHLAELVDARTAELATMNERLRAEIAEREQAEGALKESERQLRHLSAQLLAAQETERKRISRELHDELGQALSLMKLQIRSVEKGLREDQHAVREDCENILQYTDQVIENVRRLSRDLSPSVLEDLGLTAALRWLVSGFMKNCDIKVTSDIMDINNLFSQNAQIMIYRALQEALTNIGKHAGAQNVSVVIRRHEDRVSFLVEDDGKGFDTSRTTTGDYGERGLGLATMDERVRMLGGLVDMQSQEGKGTRIAFSVPIEEGETS